LYIKFFLVFLLSERKYAAIVADTRIAGVALHAFELIEYVLNSNNKNLNLNIYEKMLQNFDFGSARLDGSIVCVGTA